MTGETHDDLKALNEAYYNAYAPHSDRFAEHTQLPAITDGLIRKMIGIKKPEEIHDLLDVGAGTGKTLETIAKHLRPRRVVAVDLSSESLDLLKAKQLPLPIETVQADAVAFLEGKDKQFDAITCIASLEVMPDAPRVVTLMGRALKHGGIMAVTYNPGANDAEREEIIYSDFLEHHAAHFLWRADEVEAALSRGGMEIVDSHDGVKAYNLSADPDAPDEDWARYNVFVAVKP